MGALLFNAVCYEQIFPKPEIKLAQIRLVLVVKNAEKALLISKNDATEPKAIGYSKDQLNC